MSLGTRTGAIKRISKATRVGKIPKVKKAKHVGHITQTQHVGNHPKTKKQTGLLHSKKPKK